MLVQYRLGFRPLLGDSRLWRVVPSVVPLPQVDSLILAALYRVQHISLLPVLACPRLACR